MSTKKAPAKKPTYEELEHRIAAMKHAIEKMSESLVYSNIRQSNTHADALAAIKAIAKLF